jgi:nicotinate-nucleotide adenylyltransferase
MVSMEEKYRQKVKMIEVSALAIASSEIRRRVKKGESINYLVPRLLKTILKKRALCQ